MDKPQNLEYLEIAINEFRIKFGDLTEPHRPALWRYCLRLTGSAWDAEDLVQETMMKAFARLAYLGQPINIKAYLFRIASNAWIDQIRKTKIVPEELEIAAQIPDSNETRPAETREAIEILVKTLSPRQRVIVLLSDVFDFTSPEIAAMMETTEGVIKSALHRARTSLRKAALERDEPSGKTQTGLNPPLPIIERYMEAFNKRDPEALLALLEPDVVNDIVGDWEEHGRDQMRKFSLVKWVVDKEKKWVEYGIFEGRPVLFAFRTTDQYERALYEIITLNIVDNHIVSQKWYFFSVEMIEYAAKLLGTPAVTHSYLDREPVLRKTIKASVPFLSSSPSP
ncbi:MAG: sigma-70 family RNA polymerase sigma factor [Ignavibacteriae bacterium]|nr:sigma-70 family RNA polymerase sigma factor [Ignavibacteriota bacterium]